MNKLESLSIVDLNLGLPNSTTTIQLKTETFAAIKFSDRMGSSISQFLQMSSWDTYGYSSIQVLSHPLGSTADDEEFEILKVLCF